MSKVTARVIVNDDDIREHSSWYIMISFFNGNDEKCMGWYYSRNLYLPGGVSPQEMIATGRDGLLVAWIRDCLGG